MASMKMPTGIETDQPRHIVSSSRSDAEEVRTFRMCVWPGRTVGEDVVERSIIGTGTRQ